VPGPETKSAIQADHAWASLTVALAKTVPKKLHTGTLAAVHIRALRRRF
jgi:hypothetical protein